MPSPFAQLAANHHPGRNPLGMSKIVPATDNQITRALVPLLAERDWRNASNAAYVGRTAALNAVIRWAINPMDDATPAAVSRAIHDRVGRGAPYGERVNAILEYLSERDDAETAMLYRPLTKEGASKLIAALHELPRLTTPEVPEGRYAVETDSGATNKLAFYKVEHGKGRWVGHTFVTLIVGGGNDVELGTGQSAKAALRKIAVDPEAASIRYGREIGRCGRCGLPLTNDESRARGIGPDCAKKGW